MSGTSRRLLAILSAAALALAVAGCTAQPSADASPSASASVSGTRSGTPSASPSATGSSGASASPTDDPGNGDDSGDLGDGAEDPVAPELPATDPGPAVGSDGTVQGYDPAAVASVCIPQVQTVSAEATVAPDPTRSWRIDAANVAVEWSVTSPDETLAVVCVITGDFAAPQFVYVTLGDV